MREVLPPLDDIEVEQYLTSLVPAPVFRFIVVLFLSVCFHKMKKPSAPTSSQSFAFRFLSAQ